MFLKFVQLKKAHFTSAATRFAYCFRNHFMFLKKYPKLSINKKWKAGKGANGSTIVNTKASLLQKTKAIQVNYSYRYNKFAVISYFQFIPFKNKILSLLLFSNGAASYINTTLNHKIFAYFFILKKKKKFRRLKHKNILFMLGQIKKLSFVSLLELYPGKTAQYARGSGTGAKIIKIDIAIHTALIQLPSGVKKIFSSYSYAFLGKVALRLSNRFVANKAGYWRLFGSKSMVRGVAKNAVDHPHGGRTKSIKYPRTPWGKTTKFK